MILRVKLWLDGRWGQVHFRWSWSPVKSATRCIKDQGFIGIFWTMANVPHRQGNKHLMTDPRGNNEFCLPKTLIVSWREAMGNIEVEGKQNSLFPLGPVIKCFVTPPNSKVEKTAKKSFALHRLAHIFAAVSRSTCCCSCCCFPWELVSFVCPRELASIDPQHMTRFPPIRKHIWVGRHNKTILTELLL